jgi:choline dehydrogenase-like flavoprotein/predicted dehydrogenase
MKIFDLNQMESGSVVATDLCIIGTGPAGLTIANELAGVGIRTLVLESGGLGDEPESQALYEIESTGAPRVLDQEILRRRILGGSSHVWTGRCAPFDPWDFERRSWIAGSGWPIGRDELEPYLERAAPYLGLAAGKYDESLWPRFRVNPPTPPLAGTALRPMFWQFSRRRSGGPGAAHFGQDWSNGNATNIEILLHANVTQINVDSDGGRFESVDVSSLGGKKARIKAKSAVLCCGGIENARLMLASNRVAPNGVGNDRDTVGRYLMDHINSTVGYFESGHSYDLRSRFGHYWLDDTSGRHLYLHGVGLNRDTQERDRLVNCHAYLEQIDEVQDDAWGALKRLRTSAKSGRISGSDAGHVLSHMGEISRGVYRRTVQHRGRLGAVKRIELHLMLEQAPDPESRVTLSADKKDALGMPLSSIHWKINETERITAKRMVELVGEEFVRLGLPLPLGVPALNDQDDWIGRCTEKAHPTGSTRMSSNPADGVVDVDSKVHGVSGLFVAGSSTFPTAGAANPTLMIVATAVRLADHLKAQSAKATEPAVVASAPALRQRYTVSAACRPAPGALRIGFVGAGRRIATLYVPVLRQLRGQFELTGFTALSPSRERRLESNTGISSFRSAAELVEQGRPDLLIAAVPDRENEATVEGLLDFNLPILAETPLAWTVSGTKRIIQKAAANNVILGVAEQFPFRPLDQFRLRLVESGILGDIYTVLNDFQSYSYHGVAQLRRYLNGNPAEVRSIELASNRSHVEGLHATWQTGSVAFDNGTLLLHNFNAPYRGIPSSVCLYGTKGATHEDEVRLIVGDSGETKAFRAIRTADAAGHLTSVSADMGASGKVEWENPFAAFPFSDEEVAVATLLQGMYRAIREGTAPRYTASDFLKDIEIVQAFRYSASRNGARISLPFNEWQQKSLLLASPRYWAQKLSGR